MKPSAEFAVFVVGLLPLGFFYGQLKSAFGSELYLLLAGVAYLLLLRVVGRSVARALRHSSQEPK